MKGLSWEPDDWILGGRRYTAGKLVFVFAILALIGAVGYLVARIFKGGPDARGLPLLADVAGRSSGLLTCPVCGSASFQCPPSGSRGIFAFALGPLVFGSLSGGADVAECVTCASRFARGVPTRTLASASSA